MKRLQARKLTLHREVLRTLSAGELDAAHGGIGNREPQGSGLPTLCHPENCPKPPPMPSLNPAVACPTEPKPIPTIVQIA